MKPEMWNRKSTSNKYLILYKVLNMLAAPRLNFVFVIFVWTKDNSILSPLSQSVVTLYLKSADVTCSILSFLTQIRHFCQAQFKKWWIEKKIRRSKKIIKMFEKIIKMFEKNYTFYFLKLKWFKKWFIKKCDQMNLIRRKFWYS